MSALLTEDPFSYNHSLNFLLSQLSGVSLLELYFVVVPDDCNLPIELA